MQLRVIITGASGMVGEGVLQECLLSPHVEAVLVVGRRPCGHAHVKLKEVIHSDFFDLSPIASELEGYNACFFCLGVSSIGMNEETYRRLTYDLTVHMAETLVRQNPELAFCYVSGSGTDESDTGSSMWARVKGKTENKLIALFGPKAFNFRPGYMQPTPGLIHSLKYYKYIGWMYPALRLFFPRFVCSLAELGKAMITVALKGNPKRYIEVGEIVALAKQNHDI